MAKFSELSEPERSSVLSFHQEILRMKAQEDRAINDLGLKLLLLANGAGIAAVTPFIGIIVQADKNYQAFVWTLVLFLLGTGCAAAMLLLLMATTSEAVNKLALQLLSFVRGQIDIEQMQIYGGLNQKGVAIFRRLFVTSFVLFCSAICVAMLGLYLL